MQHTQIKPVRSHKKRTGGTLLIIFVLDILFAAGIVGIDYVYNYKLPHKLPSTNAITVSITSQLPSKLHSGTQNDAAPLRKDDTSSVGDWSLKFQDKFSDTVISTDTTYKSPNLSIELTQGSYDSGIIDHTNNGNHEKYGTIISYTLADIYISSIDCLQTAFAQDIYGVGYTESLSSMSDHIKSVLAINGDSYSNNRHKDNGTIIRNGTVYRTQSSTEETCVLFRDGTMKIYTPDTFDAKQVIADGAWQSWVFGPGLLDKNGTAKSNFLTWDYIRESHPRTAIGYYEPGHYCFLVVDGRQNGISRGMFLEEMSQFFADLGCQAAYNLDGGHCSFMTKETTIANHPYKPSKNISDGIFICEPEVLQ